MAPDVVVRKLAYLRALLEDLKTHADVSAEALAEDPYRVERILELLVTASADLLTHLLSERGEPAATYRETFRRAGELDLIPEDVSTRLEDAAGMRNVLVHLYEQIDYEIVTEGVANALKDFPRLIAALERYGRADR